MGGNVVIGDKKADKLYSDDVNRVGIIGNILGILTRLVISHNFSGSSKYYFDKNLYDIKEY